MIRTFSFHPLAEVFPMLEEGPDFERLAEDIRKNGLQHAIILYDGMILDGRARYRACRRDGCSFRTKQYKGRDPGGFVVSTNLHRRHLNARQRASIRADLRGNKDKKANVLRQWRFLTPTERQELLAELQTEGSKQR